MRKLFRKRLLDPKKEYERLFTFLKYPDVQPTNNQAEQSLRNMVIFRKVCFGTRSADGSRTHSVLPSLVLTAKRQNQHPLKFLQTLFTSATPTAKKHFLTTPLNYSLPCGNGWHEEGTKLLLLCFPTYGVDPESSHSSIVTYLNFI